MILDIIGLKLDDDNKNEIKESLKVRVKFLTTEQAKKRLKRISIGKQDDRRINICTNEEGIVNHIFRG